MLEKLDDPKFIRVSEPSADVVHAMENLLQPQNDLHIAEVGVGIGATTLALLKWMDHKGKLDIFDFHASVNDLAGDLEKMGFSNFRKFGNTRRTYDGYAWNLALLAAEALKNGSDGIYDFVYLDGAHAYWQDAPAACALKVLVKPSGYILFDDYDWTFAGSPSMNAKVMPHQVNHYTDEQMETKQVRLVCEIFFDPDPNWEEVTLPESPHIRKLYRRKA
ncbi:class I SAM-dependent methyltransferase [Parvularcula flava]|uniref:Class I SAM-dependent methyltransferase n=1 Tax=Aquisalinus luteolus TaxID=1566827 RepID=A0A8J3A2W6_9PROT|nr:class I SAM-dependent methyltransferase [Aquisalinus luteolus]NHK27260.1 class I SAM-dependent methyltransferase [Aquisalinus luteolus]GGH94896.1 hypothetical protein GCM10011355_10160 [Aquisalinus luteolus]